MSSSIVALFGPLPSPTTQLAPNNRELNKYEAYEGEVRMWHHVDLCLSSRNRSVFPYGTGCRSPLSTFRARNRAVYECLNASGDVCPTALNASCAISLMMISPATMSGRLAVNTLITSGPPSVITNPTSLATVS